MQSTNRNKLSDRKQPGRTRLRHRLFFIWVVGGASLGIFVLLFALVNDAWTIIRLPSVPWSPEPSVAVFEAKLWGIMLTCFAAGAFVALTIALWIGNDHRKQTARDRQRIKNLEAEITNVDRLVAATREKG
ncbi:MAG: LapA family protein [Deltaproteobacteria bacterium]|nr:LapA family protein [Deltaproteobacteria bacterium]